MKDQFGKRINLQDLVLTRIYSDGYYIGVVRKITKHPCLSDNILDVRIHGEMYLTYQSDVICRLPKLRKKREQILMKYKLEGMVIE